MAFFFVWLLLPHHVSWIYIFVVSILSRGSIGKKSFLELREPDFFSFSLRSQSRLSWHSSFFPHFYFNYCISGSRNGFHFFSLTRNIICFIYMCTMLCDPFRIIHSFGKLTIKDYLYVGYTHTFGEFNVTCSEWKREREREKRNIRYVFRIWIHRRQPLPLSIYLNSLFRGKRHFSSLPVYSTNCENVCLTELNLVNECICFRCICRLTSLREQARASIPL